MLHEDAIFILKRHKIGDRPERHEIEMLAQIEVRERTPFQQRVRDFENKPDAAQVVKSLAALRIHERDTLRQRAFDFVMINHDRIDAIRLQRGDLRDGRSPAIHRHQKLRMKRLDAPRHAVRAEAVTFIRAQRQETLRLSAKRAQYPREQCERRHAIHIVVAVKDDALFPIHRREQPVHRAIHVR